MKRILSIGFCLLFAPSSEAGNLRKLVDTFNGRIIHSELSNGCFRVFAQQSPKDCRGDPSACESLGDQGECTSSGWMFSCTVVDCPGGGNRGETGSGVGGDFGDLIPPAASPSVPPASETSEPTPEPTPEPKNDKKHKKKEKKRSGRTATLPESD